MSMIAAGIVPALPPHIVSFASNLGGTTATAPGKPRAADERKPKRMPRQLEAVSDTGKMPLRHRRQRFHIAKLTA
jgi:hypothetical protein